MAATLLRVPRLLDHDLRQRLQNLRLIQQLALGGFSGRINRFCVLRGNVLVSGRPEYNKSFDSKAFSWSLCTTIEISIKRAT